MINLDQWILAIVAVIAVGYAQEEPAMPKRKNVSDIANFYQG